MSGRSKTAKRFVTINERRRSQHETSVAALASFAESIDESLALLHAAVLHMQGEFVVPPSKASEIIEDAINAIRWETAQMRRGILDLDGKGGAA